MFIEVTTVELDEDRCPQGMIRSAININDINYVTDVTEDIEQRANLPKNLFKTLIVFYSRGEYTNLFVTEPYQMIRRKLVDL